MNEVYMQRPIWFGKGKVGAGFSPKGWQGWLITMAYLCFITWQASRIEVDFETFNVWWSLILPFGLSTLIFATIIFVTKERE